MIGKLTRTIVRTFAFALALCATTSAWAVYSPGDTITWSNTGTANAVSSTIYNECNFDFCIPASDDLPAGSIVRIKSIELASLHTTFNGWANDKSSDPYKLKLNGVVSGTINGAASSTASNILTSDNLISSNSSTDDRAALYTFSTACDVVVGRKYSAVTGNNVGGSGDGVAFVHSNGDSKLVYGSSTDYGAVRYVRSNDSSSILTPYASTDATDGKGAGKAAVDSGYYPVYVVKAEVVSIYGAKSPDFEYSAVVGNEYARNNSGNWSFSGASGTSLRVGPNCSDSVYDLGTSSANWNLAARNSAFSFIVYADVAQVPSDQKRVLFAFGSKLNYCTCVLYREGDSIKLGYYNNSGVLQGEAATCSLPASGYHMICGVCNLDSGTISLYVGKDDGTLDSDDGGPGSTITLSGGFQWGSIYHGRYSGFDQGVNFALAKMLGFDRVLSEEVVESFLADFPATDGTQITADISPSISGKTLTVYASSAVDNQYLGITSGTLTIPANNTVTVPQMRVNNSAAVEVNINGTVNVNSSMETIAAGKTPYDLRDSYKGILLGEYDANVSGTYNIAGTLNAPNAYLQPVALSSYQYVNINGGNVTVKGIYDGGKYVDSVAIITLTEDGVLDVGELISPKTYPGRREFGKGTYKVASSGTESSSYVFNAGSGDFTTINPQGNTLTFPATAIKGSVNNRVATVQGTGDIKLASSVAGGKVKFDSITTGYTGNITVAANTTMELVTGAYAGTITVETGGTLEINPGTDVDYTCYATLAGAGSVVIKSGNVTLANAPTVTSSISVDSGATLILPTGTISGVSGSGTLEIPNGVEVTITAYDAITVGSLKGPGTLTMSGVGPGASNATLQDLLKNSNWNGTFAIKNVTRDDTNGLKGFEMHLWGNSGSKLQLTGVQGYFNRKNTADQIAAQPELILENGTGDYAYGFKINDGWSYTISGGASVDSYTIIRKLSGAGTLQDACNPSHLYVFNDASDFSGSIAHGTRASPWGKTFLFGTGVTPSALPSQASGTSFDGDKATAGTIDVRAGASLSIGNNCSWQSQNGIRIAGDVTIKGNATLSSPTTFVDGAKLIFEAGSVLNATTVTLPASGTITVDVDALGSPESDVVLISKSGLDETKFALKSGSPAGYALKVEGDALKLKANATVAITVPTVENTTVTVTANDTPVEGDNGVYTVPYGSAVVVTYAAVDGYELSGTATYNIASATENMTITLADTVANQYVARVYNYSTSQNDQYTSLAAAVAAADGTTHATIVLLTANVTEVEVVISSAVIISGSYIINSAIKIADGGQLQLMSATLNGKLTIEDGGAYKTNGGTLGELVAEDGATIELTTLNDTTAPLSVTTLSVEGTLTVKSSYGSGALGSAYKAISYVTANATIAQNAEFVGVNQWESSVETDGDNTIVSLAFTKIAVVNGLYYENAQDAVDAAVASGQPVTFLSAPGILKLGEDETLVVTGTIAPEQGNVVLDDGLTTPPYEVIHTQNVETLTNTYTVNRMPEAAIVDTNGNAHDYYTVQAAVDDLLGLYLYSNTYDHIDIYSSTNLEVKVDASSMFFNSYSIKIKCIETDVSVSVVSLAAEYDDFVPGEPDADGVITYIRAERPTTYVWVGTGTTPVLWGNYNKWKIGTVEGATATRAPSTNDDVILNGSAPINIADNVITVSSITIVGATEIRSASGTLTATSSIVLADSSASITAPEGVLSPLPTTSVEGKGVTWSTVDGNTTYSLVDPVAKIGDNGYGSLALAIAAASDNDTITLSANSSESVDLGGKSITFNEGSYTFSGSFTGNGTLSLTALLKSADSARWAAGWRGTVVLPENANVSGCYFDNYGIDGSTVRLAGATTATWLRFSNNNKNPVAPTIEIPEGASFTLASTGFSSSFAYTFNAIKGAGAFTVNISGDINLSDRDYSAYFLLKDVSDFTGSLSATGAGIAIGDTRIANTVAGGKIIVSAGKSATIASGKTWSAANGIEVNGTLNVAGTVTGGITSGNGRVNLMGGSVDLGTLGAAITHKYVAVSGESSLTLQCEYTSGSGVIFNGDTIANPFIKVESGATLNLSYGNFSGWNGDVCDGYVVNEGTLNISQKGSVSTFFRNHLIMTDGCTTKINGAAKLSLYGGPATEETAQIQLLSGTAELSADDGAGIGFGNVSNTGGYGGKGVGFTVGDGATLTVSAKIYPSNVSQGSNPIAKYGEGTLILSNSGNSAAETWTLYAGAIKSAVALTVNSGDNSKRLSYKNTDGYHFYVLVPSPAEVTATTFDFNSFTYGGLPVTLGEGDTIIVPSNCTGDQWHPSLSTAAGHRVIVRKEMNWKAGIGTMVIDAGGTVYAYGDNGTSINDGSVISGSGTLAIQDGVPVNGVASVLCTISGEGSFSLANRNATLTVSSPLPAGKVTTSVTGAKVISESVDGGTRYRVVYGTIFSVW